MKTHNENSSGPWPALDAAQTLRHRERKLRETFSLGFLLLALSCAFAGSLTLLAGL